MNRQPPAFLERLVAWLIPAVSREHVLGDLSERYTSPAQYMFDAGRTIPFVWVGQLRRSGLSGAPAVETAFLRISMLLVLLPIVGVWVQLERGVTTPRWFAPAWMLVLTGFFFFVNRAAPRVNDPYGSVVPSTQWLLRQTLMRQIARQQRLLRFSAASGVIVATGPFLTRVAARLGKLPTPTFDLRMVCYYVALLMLSACLVRVVRADNRRRLRNLQQQLRNLT